MFLSQFLIRNRASLSAISVSRVCLFVLVQVLAWYPVVSEQSADLERHVRRQEQLQASWQKIQAQARLLEEKSFLQEDWVTYSVGDKVQGVATTWQIEGRALIKEWQVLLETVQEEVALRLVSATWKRGQDGTWYGQLLFDIQEPKRNRPYENWLPTSLKAGRFVEEDWTLVSTMRAGERASALLKHKNRPALGAPRKLVAYGGVGC